MLDWFSGVIPAATIIVVEVALLLIAVAVAPRNRRPSSALA